MTDTRLQKLRESTKLSYFPRGSAESGSLGDFISVIMHKHCTIRNY